MKEPLVKGGQGKSDKQIEDSTKVIFIAVFILAFFVLWAII